jgi:hypothetical protein
LTNPRIADGKIPSSSVPAREYHSSRSCEIGYHRKVETGQISSLRDSETTARALAGLGYPGFLYLRPAEQQDPVSVLLAALSSDDLEVRAIEALPWLVLKLKEARQREIQNRLGFVVTLSRRLAERRPSEQAKLERLAEVEAMLDRTRLVHEDTLCQQSLSAAERRWLREMRPSEARHWNLLTDLTPELLPYAA